MDQVKPVAYDSIYVKQLSSFYDNGLLFNKDPGCIISLVLQPFQLTLELKSDFTFLES